MAKGDPPAPPPEEEEGPSTIPPPADKYRVRPQYTVPAGDGTRVRMAESDLWVGADTVLEKGEPGFDGTDFKIGDGKTSWNDLVPVASKGGGGGGGGGGQSLQTFPQGATQFNATTVKWDGGATGPDYTMTGPTGYPNLVVVESGSYDIEVVHSGLYTVKAEGSAYFEGVGSNSLYFSVAITEGALFNIGVNANAGEGGTFVASEPQPFLVALEAGQKLLISTASNLNNFPQAGGYPGWSFQVSLRAYLMTGYTP